jgi:hypothetical protein
VVAWGIPSEEVVAKRRRGARVQTVVVAGAPEVCYARSGGAHIAYQVLGDGPLDLVVVSEWWSNRESEDP